jgi:hypothetical protein
MPLPPKFLSSAAIALAVSLAGPAAAGPLADLARLVPQTAPGAAFLLLPGAAGRELARADPGMASDPLNRWLYLPPPEYWRLDQWLFAAGGQAGPALLGTDVAHVEGIAGWGEPPEGGGALLLAPGAGAEVSAFLAGQGYDSRELDGVPVFWRDGDYNIDLTRYNADVYTGALGQAVRVAVRGDSLVSTHGWPPMEAALGAGQGLLGDPGRGALIEAIEAAGYGSPLAVVFIGPQVARPEAPPEGLPQAPFPAYGEAAFALWQDAGRFTSAALFLIPGDAAPARDWIAQLSRGALGETRPWDGLLPEAELAVTPSAAGDILVWSRTETELPSLDGRGPASLAHRMRRLIDAWYRRDWDRVFGR